MSWGLIVPLKLHTTGSRSVLRRLYLSGCHGTEPRGHCGWRNRADATLTTSAYVLRHSPPYNAIEMSRGITVKTFEIDGCLPRLGK